MVRALYAQAGGDERLIPWADMVVNPGLVEWLARKEIVRGGRKCITIGCGLGDDAEAMARLGFEVVAFDISPTAIEWCRARFPGSRVHYCVADLFASPESWNVAFDFVLESYTLQVLPPDLRSRAMECMARGVARGGTLLVLARGRDSEDDPGSMPWPLTRDELDHFRRAGLAEIAFEDYLDREDLPVRRFRVEYRREIPLPTGGPSRSGRGRWP